jgi:hypothetical protein
MDENDSRAVKRSLEKIESKLENIEKQLNWLEKYSFAKNVDDKQRETISVLKDILRALVNK